MKLIAACFALLFCLTTVPAFAGDCPVGSACEHSQTNAATDTDSSSALHQCAWCNAHSSKHVTVIMSSARLLEKETVCFLQPDRFHDSHATRPLLEPPAA